MLTCGNVLSLSRHTDTRRPVFQSDIPSTHQLQRLACTDSHSQGLMKSDTLSRELSRD